MSLYDVAIVGGGIIGLSVGRAITQRHPRAKILLLEKESRWGRHQTGSNSGEIHSGIYYEPGSLKAAYCRNGNAALVKFCRAYGIPHDVCGKVVVATDRKELPRLEELYRRATRNGVEVKKIGSEELRTLSPIVRAWPGCMCPVPGSWTTVTSLTNLPSSFRKATATCSSGRKSSRYRCCRSVFRLSALRSHTKADS